MARNPPPPARPPLPDAVEAAVRAAATGFFEDYCRLDLAEVVGQARDDPPAAITATISFFGDPVWSLVLGLPAQTAVAVADRFMGFDVPFDSPGMADLIGEVVNVMAGEVTNRLGAPMSLPTVLRGAAGAGPDAGGERLAFSTPAGPFWLDLVPADAAATGTRRSGR